MEDIKDIVGKIIKEIAEKDPDKQQNIQKAWETILSKKEQEHASIAGLKGSVLYIVVDSPVWLYQYNLKRKKIISEIQKEFKDIKNIYFKIGKVK